MSKFKFRNSNLTCSFDIIRIFLRYLYKHVVLWLQACHKENACHLILVKPVQDVADKADNVIIVVDRNKETILDAITSCLEQPLCKMLQEWSHLYSEDSVIHGEVDALYKTILNRNITIDPPKLPDDLKMYPSR